MSYKYKVTLTGIKGFYRIYKINGDSSLYSLHKQMRADMEFPQDQLILFKGLDADGNVVGRFGLFDLGDGAADDVTISKSLSKGIVSFVYFYDVTNRKSVNISFEGESDEPATVPALIEVKGPNPIEFEKGYVAFEDLPADKRRLPSDSEERKPSKLEELLGIKLDDITDEDEDDDDEEEEDEERDEEEQIYDESEGI